MSDKKTDYQSVCFEVVLALDALIEAFVHFLPNRYKDYEKLKYDQLFLAASSNTENFEDIFDVVRNVSSAMKNIYYDLTGEITTFSEIYRKTMELGSILHIGRSYPNDALKRAKKIATIYKQKRTKNA
jgi:hypothetical protein